MMIISLGITLASCGDVVQEMYLNKDGSGTLETTIDVGELIGMAKNFENMGSAQDTFSDDHIVDTVSIQPAVEKDAMTLLMERITDPAYDQDFDTLMSFLDIMPDSVRAKDTRPDLVQKMFFRVKSPANSGDLTFGVVAQFDNSAHLKEMVQHLNTFEQSPEMLAAAPMGMESEFFMSFHADMETGVLTVDTVLYGGFSAQMGMSQDSTMSAEDLGMVEMMFGNSKIRSVIQIPGEVLSCTNPDAILTKDNKVIIEYPMMDVIRSGKLNGYKIVFTP